MKLLSPKNLKFNMGNAPDKNDSSTGDIPQDPRQPFAGSRRRAASSRQVSEHGYEDERFEDIVSENFHCIICTNVLKHPVMCCGNEHLFCRACITKHLRRSQACPTCAEPLSVDTLVTPPRIVLNCLEELKIRCDFYDRGCRQIVQLGNLEAHVQECGFMPVLCSNEGCYVEMNARDLLHHETAVCEQRRVQCHNCAEFKQEIQVVKDELTAASQKLIAEVNQKLDKLELHTEQLEADNEEMKQTLGVVVEQLNRIVKLQETSSLQSKHM